MQTTIANNFLVAGAIFSIRSATKPLLPTMSLKIGRPHKEIHRDQEQQEPHRPGRRDRQRRPMRPERRPRRIDGGDAIDRIESDRHYQETPIKETRMPLHQAVREVFLPASALQARPNEQAGQKNMNRIK